MSVPTTQKALRLEKPPGEAKRGERNVAVIRDIPVPKADGDKVLVKIHAAGFNRRDEWSMIGAYPGLTFNSTMGCDGAGTVVSGSVASSLTSHHPKGLVILIPMRGWESDPTGPEAEVPGASDKVRKNALGGQGFGILGSTKATGGEGTFCEYIAVERDHLVPAPRHLDATMCAALGCGGVTAWRALFTKAKVSQGQNLLITGIGGGVAQLACQLAVAAGANVFVTGGSEAKVKNAVSKLGAKGGALYKDEKWPSHIRSQLPEGRPYLDAVVDSAGGNIVAQSLKAGLRAGGRVVCFGMTAHPKITYTMREVLGNIELLGSTMGSNEEFRACVRFIDQHKIVPVLDTILEGLDQADKGFALLGDAEKRSGGKVIVRVVNDTGSRL